MPAPSTSRSRWPVGGDLDAQARSTSRSSVRRRFKVATDATGGVDEPRPPCSPMSSPGANTDGGLLVVIDGAKALASAVGAVFGDTALIQRCRMWRRACAKASRACSPSGGSVSAAGREPHEHQLHPEHALDRARHDQEPAAVARRQAEQTLGAAGMLNAERSLPRRQGYRQLPRLSLRWPVTSKLFHRHAMLGESPERTNRRPSAQWSRRGAGRSG
jgi:hypothetical protein